MSRCDVIIPVYNAFDSVVECIESLLKRTNFEKNHLIIIDDCSSDKKILPMLQKYVKKYPGKITLLENDKNLGFVGTVNRGMKYSKNDVLLLNSDTEVTDNWLEKIKKCAYADKNIATVTPLSNNATLASVPKIFKRNELPEKITLEEMGKIVEECSFKKYPNIPTAHGFCMFIKREIIEEIGYFDQETFGKGYGEENDFSFRCIEKGYRNVLCDDVYILHKESQSFLDEKVDNSNVLARKHPELTRKLDDWCHIRDIEFIGGNIALALGEKEKRANILIVIHDWSNIEENVGGTTLHVLDIIKNLREKYNFHVLFPDNLVYKVHSYFKDSDTITSIYRKPIDISPVCMYSLEYKTMFEKIIKEYGISFVHIHHIFGHYFDIKNACNNCGVEYCVSLHDFYLQYPEICKMSERVQAGNPLIAPKVWRGACGDILNGAVSVIAPTDFTKKEYHKIYKEIKIDVIEHGVDFGGKKNGAKKIDSPVKNIAFIGVIHKHKGSRILNEIVKNNLLGDVKIHLFGSMDISVENSSNFINHGKYKRDELPKLFEQNNIEAVCILSLAPETYSYTVSEAIACGVPVISFDIGAAGERIIENNLGWVIKYQQNIKKNAEDIGRILNNINEYNEKIDSIKKYELNSVKKMSDNYEMIYRKYDKKKIISKEIKTNLEQVYLINETLSVSNGINYCEIYNQIINSKRWKLISRVKIPNNVKKIAKVILKRK